MSLLFIRKFLCSIAIVKGLKLLKPDLDSYQLMGSRQFGMSVMSPPRAGDMTQVPFLWLVISSLTFSSLVL